MSIWMQILWGMAAILIIFMFWPGAKVAMEKSREAENKDWKGFLIPIFAVILFVLFLISIVRS